MSNASFAQWDWDDPDRFAAMRSKKDSVRGRRNQLDAVSSGEGVLTREILQSLGLNGAEFGSVRTSHSRGLAADFVELWTADSRTDLNRLYRVDDADYFVNLSIADELPFEDDCLDWVYAEHLIEHVTFASAVGWLREVRRVVAPGGLVRVTTPDLRKYLESYVLGGDFFEDHRRRMDEIIRGPRPMPSRPSFMVNQIFYFYGHRWIYDVDEVSYALRCAGFEEQKISVREFSKGSVPSIAKLDQEFRCDESIYVEAAI
jgi:predicted SAM-dependent methyltransferase